MPWGLTWPGGGLPDRDVVKELHLSQEQDRILTRAVESATGKVLKKLMFAVRDNAGAGGPAAVPFGYGAGDEGDG